VIVLVTIDTLRADAVSFMGNPLDTTPFLDSLAENGIIFERAYSNSWTVPSMASLFTSRYPSSHGVVSGEVQRNPGSDVWNQPVLPLAVETLAEAFQRAGFRTIGVAANRHLQAGTGFERGFEKYFDTAKFLTANTLNNQVYRLMKEAFGPTWRDSWKSSKTFLWVHYFDPHLPYYPRRPWIHRYAPDFQENSDAYPGPMTKPQLLSAYSSFTKVAPRLEALYLSEVSFFDQHLRQLFEELGVDDSTLVMITADHGEEIDDHGGISHGQTLYEEVVHVPMLLKWTRGLPRGKSVRETVTLLDVYPTLTELAGLKTQQSAQGRSVLPLIEGGKGSKSLPSFVEQLPPRPALEAVVTDRWKLIRPLTPGSSAKLFDLHVDPEELHSLNLTEKQQVKHLEALLQRWRRDLPAAPEVVYFSSDDEELTEQLRSLGYIE
jgi:arylsulfatase A-like enzyme